MDKFMIIVNCRINKKLYKYENNFDRNKLLHFCYIDSDSNHFYVHSVCVYKRITIQIKGNKFARKYTFS